MGIRGARHAPIKLSFSHAFTLLFAPSLSQNEFLFTIFRLIAFLVVVMSKRLKSDLSFLPYERQEDLATWQ